MKIKKEYGMWTETHVWAVQLEPANSSAGTVQPLQPQLGLVRER